jgi:uncharacterized membrane protein
MDAPLSFLLILLILLVIISPVLAISAYARVRKLQATEAHVPEWLQRLYALEKGLAALERKLTDLEKRLSDVSAQVIAPRAPVAPPLESTATPAAPSATPQQVAPSPPPAPVVPRESAPSSMAAPILSGAGRLPAPPAKPPSLPDLETLIAGRWLNRVGILALLLAVSFFLKYAFENDWIGPTGRVAIGILIGSAMLPWSQWLLGRGYPYFSEGIAALGEAVLYVSVWAGWHYYALFSQSFAFAAMIVVTAVMAAVAIGRNSERIALLSLLGGFLTPEIISTGKNEQVVLFTYLLVLGAGMLLIASKRNWRSLAPVSFVLTQIYFWLWFDRFYASQALERTVAFATLFFVLYAAVPVVRAMRLGRLSHLDTIFTLINAGAFLVILRATLWPEYRWALTVAVLLLSAGHLAVARLAPAPKAGESPLMRILFAGLALTFATLAIPIRLDGKWITIAWALEGAILIWSGFRAVTPLLRRAGYFLLSVAALRLLFVPIPAPQFLFNARFAAYAVVVACFGVSLAAARSQGNSLSARERQAFGILAVAINAFSLLALSLEFWDYFGRSGIQGLDRMLAQHLALSVLWTAYATALIFLGVRRQSALVRWLALALFGLVAGKVFLYDLSYLERFYRILSFLILGLVLMVVSFLYQRKVVRERSHS